MTVKRYVPYSSAEWGDSFLGMQSSPEGEYVLHADYQELQCETRTLRGLTMQHEDNIALLKQRVSGVERRLMDAQGTVAMLLGNYGTAGFEVTPTGEIQCSKSGTINVTNFELSDSPADHTADALRYATVGVDWGKHEDPEPPTAPDILEAGAQHMRDRAKLYDQPGGERSMAHCVSVFEALTGITLTAQDGWLFMVVLKLVRAQKNPDHMDNYEDACAYVALLAEEQAGDL